MTDETNDITADLTKEDIAIAKSKIKDFTSNSDKLLSGYAGNGVLAALAMVGDKLCRDDEGNFKPGIFYTYITSRLLSDSSLVILQNLLQKRQITIENDITEKLHHEFDSFPIAEREARNRNTEKIMTEAGELKTSAVCYLGAKSGLVNSSITSATLIAASLASGGAANLPIMVGVMGASAISSYLINRKLNAKKIKMKSEIREQNALLKAADRQMYVASYKLETSDKSQTGYKIFNKQKSKFEASYHKFIDILNKYAKIETLIKTAVIGGVVAATIANPVNSLVMVGATAGVYSAVTKFVNSSFSLKEHTGVFASTYKQFKSKLKVKFGKEKIKPHANVIELDNVVVKKRNGVDPLLPTNETLFEEKDKFYIDKGITLLAGASGAGKSSLINLLMHSNDVDGGNIRIGEFNDKGQFSGTDYKDLAFGEPAKHIALSMQKPSFIEVTVDEYIRLSNPNAPEELVQKVKEVVGINESGTNESINPNTIITPSGNNISGGQANRLNLAQALIKDSPIMILDEPTSGVDPTIAENIVNYLNEIKDKKTIIYVTHNIKDVENLQFSQALDIARDAGNDVATIERFDASQKEEYLKIFADRNTARSPSSENNSESDTQEKSSHRIDIDQVRKLRRERKHSNRALAMLQELREKMNPQNVESKTTSSTNTNQMQPKTYPKKYSSENY